MPALMSIGAHADESVLAREIRAAMPPGAFNLSVLRIGESTYVAAREPVVGAPTVTAALYHFSDGTVVSRHDLTAVGSKAGVPVVADPKLVLLGGRPWVTFNSGWDRIENRLYLCPADEVGPPIECVFDERQPVEKNWAFFGSPDALSAVYSLDPVRLLSGTQRDERTWVFRRTSGPTIEPVRARRMSRELSLGSQPVVVDGELRLIAHEKTTYLRRRTYLGRAVALDLTSPAPSAKVSGRRLVHSIRALSGSKPRRNPNLLSCTYFSGLDIADGQALLSYGINDHGFGLARLPWESLW